MDLKNFCKKFPSLNGKIVTGCFYEEPNTTVSLVSLNSIDKHCLDKKKVFKDIDNLFIIKRSTETYEIFLLRFKESLKRILG